jgi:hypothetical protein
MMLRSLGSAIAIGALANSLLAVSHAAADDRGVVGRKLVIIDKLVAAGTAKVVFVSKDTTPGAVHKGASANPPGLGGGMSIFPLSDATGNRGEFALEDGADGLWLVNKETVAKYVNKEAGIGALGVKVAVVKPDKVLKVVAKNLGDGDAATGDDGPMDLDPGAVTTGDTMRVVVEIVEHEGNGIFTTHRMCADFDDLIVKSIGGDTGTKIVSKSSTAPADCDDTTVTTTTTTPGSTTTTTIATACDVFTQDCPSGEACYPTSSNPAADCAAAGTGGPGNGCSQNGHCAIGFTCVVTSSGGECNEICQIGGAPVCPGNGIVCQPLGGTGIPDFGVCSATTPSTIPSTTTTTMPPATCDVFLQDCLSGFGCYPTGTVPATQCLPAGTLPEGATCASLTSCQAGLVCIGSTLGTACRQICELGGPAICAGFSGCTAVPGSNIPDFGVCL